MTTTDDPEVFAERWHEYIENMGVLEMELPEEQFNELDEALDALHDLVDEAAEDVGETQ